MSARKVKRQSVRRALRNGWRVTGRIEISGGSGLTYDAFGEQAVRSMQLPSGVRVTGEWYWPPYPPTWPSIVVNARRP